MNYVIKNALIVNEGQSKHSDVWIKDQRIEKIDSHIEVPGATEINAEGLVLLPGAIDDQVHFREPGLTHKGEIFTESRAAVAGGITSYMEMPNTVPNAFTQELLADKYARAAQVSLANYSFFMGTSNDNLEEVLKTDAQNVCGVKIFMGSSTGDMLVDNPSTLEQIFSKSNCLIATHCEDEGTVKRNLAEAVARYGEDIPLAMHPIIRSAEACYLSSSFAVQLAKKHNTRLHILHISTERETHLFQNDIPLEKKHITSEACIHHLWFSEEDYATKGNFIKWNPAVKTAADREGVWKALLDGRIDVIATDHAPHTSEEKAQKYAKAPSGGPLVQHSVLAMWDFVQQGKITAEMMVQKMAHNPAILFRMPERGFIREGYYADLVLLDPKAGTEVTKESLLYKCKWSPFEGHHFKAAIKSTFVSGHLAYNNGKIDDSNLGMRLKFSV